MATAKRKPIERSEIVNSFSALWWLGILQGMLMLFFGAAAVFWPALTLLTLVYLFSGFILAWAVVELLRGLMGIGRRSSWWLSLAFGLGGLVVGVYLLRHLDVSVTTFVLLVGLTLIARGIFDLVGAFLDGYNATDKVLAAVTGIAALAAGIIILLSPASGGVAFVWVLGIYALVAGTMMLVTAIGLYEAFSELSQGFERSTVRIGRVN